MITKIKKWGNSLGVKIPKSVAQDIEIHEGANVDVVVENGRLVIVPVKRRYTLKELVGKITPENRHAETDWGHPVGEESW